MEVGRNRRGVALYQPCHQFGTAAKKERQTCGTAAMLGTSPRSGLPVVLSPMQYANAVPSL
eukprot:1609038-Rhodomonas_salina.2